MAADEQGEEPGGLVRVMALDIGSVRIGIAVSDPQERVATPLCVLPSSDVKGNGTRFRRLLEDWEPELFVVGMPYSLNKNEGPQAKNIRQSIEQISQVYDIPYVFVDERLSSLEAKRNLREEGATEKEMRGKIDMIAASLFLQTWLDARNAQKQQER